MHPSRHPLTVNSNGQFPTGTNTYLIGSKPPYILLDTGEGKEAYIPLLKQALQDAARSSDTDTGLLMPGTGGQRGRLVSDIIVSHRHHDHHYGVPGVLDLLRQSWGDEAVVGPYAPPRIHKFPLPSHHPPDSTLDTTLAALQPGTFEPSPTGHAFHDLHDRQLLSAPDSSLQIIHTPGHTVDSVCVYLREETVLFTADTVLGQGTAVFEDLGAYIASLRLLIGKGPDGSDDFGYDKIYPGHGAVVENGRKTIEMYIQHRQEREDQIVQLMSSPPPDNVGAWTTLSIVATLYAAYPKGVWRAAAHGVLLHLAKLEGEGRVRKSGFQPTEDDGSGVQWELVARL